MGINILLIALVTSLACSIIGVFLVVRKMSMMTDAISHTVLLGIVLTFLLVPNLDSPLLIFGAILMGLITVTLIESLVKTKKVNEDAATGVVFPLLFSIAIIIITLFISDVHMDVDAVLLGKLELASIEKLFVFGVNIGPKSLYIGLLVLVINILFIIIFFKELKIVSFDSPLAKVLGISPIIIHYLLMVIVSFTAVTSFSSVGSVLVVALMIGPAITAMQFTKDLKYTIIYSAIIAAFNTIIGYIIAININVTISGVIATTTLVTFILVLLFNPISGILFKVYRRANQKNEFAFLILLIHIFNHQNNNEDEIRVTNIHNELNWSENKINFFIKLGIKEEYLINKNDLIFLTEKGRKFHDQKIKSIT